MVIEVKNESEMRDWFEKNYKTLGYSKIVRHDGGIFPDFLMEKEGKQIGVELETISSNFVLHKHDITKVDEIVCIEKDIELGLPIIIIKELKFSPRIRRISATVDPSTVKLLETLIKNGKYRNKSHVIETAIEKLAEEENGK